MKDDGSNVEVHAPAMTRGVRRERLPDERQSVTQKFVIHDGREIVELYLTVGFYDDGRIGEMFIRVKKEGSLIQTILDQWATAVSVGLQYGIPLDVFIEKAEFTRCEPAGFVEGCDVVRMCNSPIDCIARYMRAKFLEGAATPVGVLE